MTDTERNARALALAAQAAAHSYDMMQDASSRLGGTLRSDENVKLLKRADKLAAEILRFTKRLARERNKADGYGC